MLVIREQQIHVLRAARRRDFEERTTRYVQRQFPTRCTTLGDTATQDQVHTAVGRALDYGLSAEADVLRYVNLTFALGLDFDRSGQYPWVEPILADRRYTPEVRIALLAQLALQRAGLSSPVATKSTTEPAPAAPEQVAFDGIELGEEEPAADPNLPEPYDGDLPPDPEEDPLPPLPEFAQCDPHFRGLA